MRLLEWVRARRFPVTAGALAKEYFKVNFDMTSHWHHTFEKSKILLESLAFNGYLLRGRFHTAWKGPRTGEPRNFSGTHYRCSVKARKLLIDNDPSRS